MVENTQVKLSKKLDLQIIFNVWVTSLFLPELAIEIFYTHFLLMGYTIVLLIIHYIFHELKIILL